MTSFLPDFAGNIFQINLAKNLKKVWIIMCGFWLFIALLEFGQDYLEAWLNEREFRLTESLSYKLFWLIYVPLTWLILKCAEKGQALFNHIQRTFLLGGVVILVSILHLIVFASILFGISHIIHTSVWDFTHLIIEKFSTRLYLSIAVYGVVVWLYLKALQRPSLTKQDGKDALSIRTGGKVILLRNNSIHWIQSDGPYLSVHTQAKKYLIIDTLKSIITTLPPNFKRIHRSTIVNMDKISEFRSRGNGDYDVIMENEVVLRLSRNYAKSVKALLF